MSEDVTSLRTDWTTTSVEEAKLLRRLTEQRFESDQLRVLGSAVRVAGQGIAIMTPAVEALGPRIAFVNDGFCAIYGRPREEIIGETPVAFGIVERHQAIFHSLLQHVFARQAFAAEATAQRKDGQEFELDMQLVPVEDGGQLTHWVAFLRDVTDSRNEIVALKHQAMHDGLTDLPNRMMLFDRLAEALEAARSDGRLIALLLMDLDRFKEVNDTFGHHFGDVLLKQVAFRLRNQLHVDDTVARLGGDEFAIVLTSAIDPNAVAMTARRILNSLQQPFVVEGQVLEVGASIGIALYPQHGSDARTLMRRADVAMYATKQSNAGFTFHERDEPESRVPDQLSLVVEMRTAIERNEFELYYQPKRHLHSGLVTRVEVLIRWNHPRRGLLMPVSFVPIAERTGLIKPMTDWILDKALQQCREWQDAGAPIHVAVNVSAKSLLEETLPSKVQSLLDKWNIDPRFLKIEITESSIMADPAHALAIMSMLQSMGVRLSVDDFGTGYSSLTHLRQLPIDEIKIDKAFVLGMLTSDADAAIVRTVIDLAHNLGKQVCAEGVEDAETLRRLEEMGCDLAQGYYISHAVPAAALMTWLTENSWGLKRM
ncbi:MAG: EAL domain-containing protein [Acidobacteria bacterium]|nr:EAL domain-containing protein [Acidobacteriota bacterium]MBV9067464.1 EAL domain-containing protein [Acidobacteriota bacterium]MBV9186950.1 EAL domain-containing protein [Acidobacteriota bacterium]